MTKSISELRPVGIVLNAWEQTTGCRGDQWLAMVQCIWIPKLVGESKNESHRTRLFLTNLLHEWMRSGQKEKRSVECEWILLIVCVEMGLGWRGNHLAPKNVACFAVGGPTLFPGCLTKRKRDSDKESLRFRGRGNKADWWNVDTEHICMLESWIDLRIGPFPKGWEIARNSNDSDFCSTKIGLKRFGFGSLGFTENDYTIIFHGKL